MDIHGGNLMENRVMTQEELQTEVQKVVKDYRTHCVKQRIAGEQLKERVAAFEKMLGMCANEFQLARSQDKIPGELVDWLDFYHGYIAGVQYGQQMTADTLGVGETVREATGR